MSKIFELFGYPVDSWSEQAWKNLKRCHCPFMDSECDGGGNRFSSGITLQQHKELIPFFNGQKRIQAGVCSLQIHEGEQPWIVCPRRLLNFRSEDLLSSQKTLIKKLFSLANFVSGKRYKIWSEIKIKCNVVDSGKESLFDYTFDYVIAGCGKQKLSKVCELLGKTEYVVRKLLEERGVTIAFREGEYWCDEFPQHPLVIVEVMTSSTSGGNERNRTQVSQVFEDTILQLAGKNVSPEGPGINYRQVWARMVSQLLVKSQVGVAWGGTTFWVIQDLLADYISKTTALTLSDFLSDKVSEVNIISGGYSEAVCPEKRRSEIIDIPDVKTYSGPVSAKRTSKKSFVDIVKLGCTPSVNEIWRRLIEKKACATFVL